jgi:hypothetical protein
VILLDLAFMEINIRRELVDFPLFKSRVHRRIDFRMAPCGGRI